VDLLLEVLGDRYPQLMGFRGFDLEALHSPYISMRDELAQQRVLLDLQAAWRLERDFLHALFAMHLDLLQGRTTFGREP
jgi:hypothetical protein